MTRPSTIGAHRALTYFMAIALLASGLALLVGPASQQVSAEIEADAISIEAPVEITNSRATPVSIVTLTSSTFMVCYIDIDDLNRGKLVIGTVTDGVITYGTPIIIPMKDGMAFEGEIHAIDANTFVLLDWDSTGPGPETGRLTLGTVSGDVITLGQPYEFSGDFRVGTATMLIMDPTHVLVAYNNLRMGGGCFAVVGTINENDGSITYGTTVSIHDTLRVTPTLVRLTSDRFVVYAEDYPNISPYIVLGSIDGDVITLDDTDVLPIALHWEMKMMAMGEDCIIMTYLDWNSDTPYYLVYNIQGGSLVAGEPVQITEMVSYLMSSAALNDHTIIVFRNDGEGNGEGIFEIGTFDGNTITFSEAIYMTPSETIGVSTCEITVLSPTSAVVVYDTWDDRDALSQYITFPVLDTPIAPVITSTPAAGAIAYVVL